MKCQLLLARRALSKPVTFARLPNSLCSRYAISTLNSSSPQTKLGQQSLATHLDTVPLINPHAISTLNGSSPQTKLAQQSLATHLDMVPLDNPKPPSLHSNWLSIEDQPLKKSSLMSLFNNCIASIRYKNFLSSEEYQRLVDVVATHKMGSYNEDVYPPIGAIGISHFDHQKDKEKYFKLVAGARSLQTRFVKETGIDVLSRVAKLLAEVSGLPVRIAMEGGREYFAGLLRMINSTALLHADFAPYDGPEWEIGRVSSQLSWNILLKGVDGGESIVYDRFWRGDLDRDFKKSFPSYGYSPRTVENRAFKVIQPSPGDLTFFNSRNFHEVKQIDRPQQESRFTMSSFVGYLEESVDGPAIILWS